MQTLASKVDLSERMQSEGYFVLLVFVGLASVELSIARAATRVAMGGHAVSEPKLRERFPRTREAITLALNVADAALLVDNSRNEARAFTVARVEVGRVAVFDLREAAELAALRDRVSVLGRYQSIVDAEAFAAKVRVDAERAAAELANHARSEAEQRLAEAHATLTRADASARATQAQATTDASAIVRAAEEHAQKTAGEALTAIREAARLERTAEAMRNVIEGYGDRYVVPTAGLLDELAEEFGFAEAGQRLRAARDRSRKMALDGTASTCDYVEAHRRATAVAFVLDAFNGKVDTILGDVRHDNVGVLRRRIQDAFDLVNHNGEAFRHARIEPAYLEARLDELKWAVVAQELKLREREEQRQLKERIREEEKAQREFERATREAAKEEEMLRRAMDKVRHDVEKASEAQRAQYESQLQELAENLRLTEEKNQRALSMAQQTRSGHVYVISSVGSFGEHVYKIGMTRRLEPRDRVRELGDASVPFEFDVHAMIPSADAPALEHALHKRFVRHQVNKVNARKEFFRVPLEEVRAVVEAMKCEASWTIAAAAREYLETQAIEKAMANRTLDERAWSEQQLRELATPIASEVEVEATA